MEGYSIISYNGKSIHYFDYSVIGHSNEKVIQLLQYATEEYKKLPPKSALVLVNLLNLHISMEVLSVFKEERLKSTPYEKKIAAIGMRGVIGLAYNFMVAFGQGNDFIKAFDTEQQAKEWLVSD
jgi:hypothetical protein